MVTIGYLGNCNGGNGHRINCERFKQEGLLIGAPFGFLYRIQNGGRIGDSCDIIMKNRLFTRQFTARYILVTTRFIVNVRSFE